MTIEIHEPELEALIQRRMESGRFESVEDVLLQALKASPDGDESSAQPKQSLTQFLMDSPLWNSGLELERSEGHEKSKAGRTPGRKSLAELFAESPFRGLDLEFPRDNDPLRPIDL